VSDEDDTAARREQSHGKQADGDRDDRGAGPAADDHADDDRDDQHAEKGDRPPVQSPATHSVVLYPRMAGISNRAAF